MQRQQLLTPRSGWVNRIILYGLLGLGLLALLAWAVVAYRGIHTLEELVQKNEKLQAAITELTLESQIGYAKLEERRIEGGQVINRIKFVETAWDDPKTEVFSRVYEIPGEEIYFDAMIVKFDSTLVQDGTERALYLWRRLYSEKVAPEAGYALQEPGGEPERYREWLTKLPLKQRQLFWSEIWDLSNQPQQLEALGIRAVFGTAVYQRMEPKKVYVFKINKAGQIYPEAIPDM